MELLIVFCTQNCTLFHLSTAWYPDKFIAGPSFFEAKHLSKGGYTGPRE